MKTINVNNTIENFLSGSTGKAEETWLKRSGRIPDLAREVALRRRTDEILADRSIIDLRTKLGIIEMKKRSAEHFARQLSGRPVTQLQYFLQCSWVQHCMWPSGQGRTKCFLTNIMPGMKLQVLSDQLSVPAIP